MSLKPRRIPKKSKSEELQALKRERHDLPCKECGEYVYDLTGDISGVTCSDCCIRMSAPPNFPAKQKLPEDRRPRGWQFMKEYRAPEGTLYHRGVKVDESIPTKSTSGTKRPTVRKTTTASAKADIHRERATESAKPRPAKRKPAEVTPRRNSVAKPAKRTKLAAKKVVKRKSRRPAV